MKFQMNFTTSYDDVIRFTSAEAPGDYDPPEFCPLLKPDMITGVHCCWKRR